MRLFLAAATVLSLGVSVLAQPSATAVLDHHVAVIKKGDLEGVMSDYAEDTVVIVPHGIVPGQTDVSGNDVFAGKQNARKFFAVLVDKDHLPAVQSMDARYESLGHDTILIHRVQYKGTSQEVRGTDTWVIRNGKVIFQMVAVEAAKK